MTNRAIMTRAVLTGVGACIVALMASGGGHGTYWAAKCLFPYTMLSTAWTTMISIPFILLAVLQFPLYGVLLAVANVKRKLAWGFWGVVGIHLIGVALAVRFSGSGFTPWEKDSEPHLPPYFHPARTRSEKR